MPAPGRPAGLMIPLLPPGLLMTLTYRRFLAMQMIGARWIAAIVLAKISPRRRRFGQGAGEAAH